MWTRSAFYREYYAGHGIREADLEHVDVEDLPFTSKDLLMANLDRVVTDPELRRDDLERWLDETRDPRETFRRGFIVMHSSGSSGRTGISVYSRADWQVMNAIMAVRLPSPENYPTGKTRVAFYRVAHGHFAGITTAMHLPGAVYETLIASVLDPLERVIDELHRFQPHRLTGYSSSISRLADLALEGRLRIAPRRIFVSGDLLTPAIEGRIRAAWPAPICNLYGASESLFLAVRDEGDEVMTVMDDLNVLEVLDEAGRAVGTGEEGRVVVTNLYNHTLPVLRYELGDHVTRGEPSDASGFSTIRAIRPGKASDALPILLDNGAPDTVSARALTSFYAGGLERVQFVVQPGRIRIDYESRRNVDDEVGREFRRILALKGALRMGLEVRRMESIPADPVTGKVNLVRHEGVGTTVPARAVTREVRAGPVTDGGPDPAPAFQEFPEADTELSIVTRFERRVASGPDRPAVKTSKQTLTYDALNRAANRVAHAVRALAGGAPEPVGLVLEQGLGAIVALLGVLKAGKFYVPMDPAHPRSWLGAIVTEARPSVIVTNRANLALATELATREAPAAQVLDTDALASGVSDSNPGAEITADALAYLFYTSGTTGRPKGVAHDHRHVLRQTMSYTNGLRLGPADCLTLLHSHGFSASRLDIFGAILNGAALFPFSVVDEGLRPLARGLLEQGVTVLHWVPTAFSHFAAGLSGAERFPRLRWIVLGSEGMTPRDVALYHRRFAAGAGLVNRYGTTETGNIAWRFVDPLADIGREAVPVGRAIGDAEPLVLDVDGREVASGQVGEIAVRTRFLPAGYWGRPDLTAEAFVPDRGGHGERVYRTGDVGYRLPDGDLVHLGRKDAQAKIRGHRVELGEIERVLLEHPAVGEAVVVLQAQPTGSRLVAYMAPREETAPAIGALRKFVEARLPGYMVPALFVTLPALPRTPGGKLDRRALPEPEDDARGGAHPKAPRDPVEETLSRIWSEVLGVARIDVDENFFDLGGHSLHAGQIVTRVMDVYGVLVPLRDLFDGPTVAAMSESVRSEMARAAAG